MSRNYKFYSPKGLYFISFTTDMLEKLFLLKKNIQIAT